MHLGPGKKFLSQVPDIEFFLGASFTAGLLRGIHISIRNNQHMENINKGKIYFFPAFFPFPISVFLMSIVLLLNKQGQTGKQQEDPRTLMTDELKLYHACLREAVKKFFL